MVRFYVGYLLILLEEKVLGFEEIEDDGDWFEFEYCNKSVKGLFYCGKKLGLDEYNVR